MATAVHYVDRKSSVYKKKVMFEEFRFYKEKKHPDTIDSNSSLEILFSIGRLKVNLLFSFPTNPGISAETFPLCFIRAS